MYLLALFIMIAAYVLFIIFLLPKFRNTFVTNVVFGCLIFVLYAVQLIIILFDVGPNDWMFKNALPIANISPFIFCTMAFFFLLPKKLQKYHLTLISLLSAVMFIAPCVSCVRFTLISYRFHASFLLFYVAHFALSLWGIYLVMTKQVELAKKDCLISAGVITAVAFIMIILNLIFDTAFFGLSLRGKHNIYDMIFVHNSFLSALIYFAGLFIALFLGYLFQTTFEKMIHKYNSENPATKEIAE